MNPEESAATSSTQPDPIASRTTTLESKSDESTIRAAAITRAWLCPGAGFARLGRPWLGMATYLVAMAWALSVGGVVFEPSSTTWRVSTLLLAAAVPLWVAELITVRAAAIRQAKSTLLVDAYPTMAGLSWLAGLPIVGLFFCFSSITLAGNGMSPTVKDKEKVVYHTLVRPEELRRGQVIMYRASRNSLAESGVLLVGRIAAMPGDKIAVAGDHYLINGVQGPPLGEFSLRLAVVVPEAPAFEVVPKGCYFMCQDNSAESFDSRVLSWAEDKDIVSHKLWYLRGDRPWASVE